MSVAGDTLEEFFVLKDHMEQARRVARTAATYAHMAYQESELRTSMTFEEVEQALQKAHAALQWTRNQLREVDRLLTDGVRK